MRKALVVGIDFYERIPGLFGCVNDAHSVRAALERHADGSVNFDVKLLVATGEGEKISRAELKDSVKELFAGDEDIALFYFAGHGHIELTGGYLITSDSTRGDEGVALGDVLAYANASRAKNKLVILDSCHSGIAGAPTADPRVAELTTGVTILTASTDEQYASEKNGAGVFTGLLVDALGGAACNLLGDITPGSVYAHIDQSLGAWEQRPVFKTNVQSFVSLRSVRPQLELSELQRITEFFPKPGFEYELDPSYEPRDEGRTPEMPPADPKNNEVFAILQKFNRVNLVVPAGTTHMWNAAMESKSCMLTALGEHYRRLGERGRL